MRRLPSASLSIVILVTAAAAAVALGTLAAPPHGAATATPAATPSSTLSGRLRAPGGPFLLDHFGRVVLLHGVNVVYKRPPFEVYPDPGHPWNFGAADARRIARLGFDVVRLGIVWQGLEPGSLPPNDPKVCARGRPGNPHQLRLSIVHRYLERLKQTVDLLGREHVYVILDMHQDVYSSVLGGEGAPRWAVCTDGIAPSHPPGRWSKVYGTPAADAAFDHFWDNDVVGNLQGQFDRVWQLVAHFFRGDPWVVGFDPYNEPFSVQLLTHHREHFDAELECFYTGSAHAGVPRRGVSLIRCPPGDPVTGVIPTIEAADPGALVFFEPDIYSSRGRPTYLGAMPFPRLVFNVHLYCPQRNPRTGNPSDIAACASADAAALARHMRERASMASRFQPRGPGWLVSEFGATSNVALVRRAVAELDARLVGWAYWSWKYYRDPTGSADEALVRSTGRYRPTVGVLSEPYARAVAGVPLSMRFNPSSARFVLRYRPAPRRGPRRVDAPTLVAVPRAVHYVRGYCAAVVGGRVLSEPGAPVLEVEAARRARTVTVTVSSPRTVHRRLGHLRPVCG